MSDETPKCSVFNCTEPPRWRVRSGSTWADFCENDFKKAVGIEDLDEILVLPLKTKPKGQM